MANDAVLGEVLSSSRRLRRSATVYFSCVALATALGFATMMLFRPTLAHSVREWLGLERPFQAAANSFYLVRVAPLWEEHCVGCHGARRQKANLRLDSYAAVMRGGKHGPVIHPGSVKESELLARITLPASNEKAMPASGKPSLSPDEVTVIKLWIAAGASGVQPVDAFHGAPKPVVQVRFPELDEATVQRQRGALASVVKSLQSRFPGIIDYESRGSANLDVNASLEGVSFGDADLKALVPLYDHMVWADFSGTAITDASAPMLATMKALRALRLMNTKVTDTTIRALAPLKELRSLTVAGTGATEHALGPLRKNGIKIYDGHDVQ